MEKDLIINGFRMGEYSFDPNKIEEEFNWKWREGMNYASISTNHAKEEIPQETFIKMAKFFADKKIYFSFDGGGHRPHVGFTEETAKKMKEIAGEYFYDYHSGEMGSYYSCKGRGYEPLQDKKWADVQQARDFYVDRVREAVTENSMGGVLDTSVVESSTMVMYNTEAGQSHPTMEFWPGDMEIAAAFTRGAATSFKCKKWSAYFAHEWYGGLRWDELKEKRFKMGYDFCYLSGAKLFVNESGDEISGSHGEERYDYDHPKTQNYRKVMADFAKFTMEDARPVGGPKVKVAFVYGNLDGYSFRHSGGSLWRGHLQQEFGYNTPEYAWRILENLQCKRRWFDVHNYGEIDLSGAPAYGLYDVVSASADVDVLSKYDYLIFAGWNSMTDELYKKLKIYVERGGRLFMTAAHLNTSIKRDGSISLVNGGDVSDLFGCTLDADNPIEVEDGSKLHDSIVPEFLYPRIRFHRGDPYFAEGYIKHAKTTLTTGVATGRLSNDFIETDEEAMPPSLVENKCGEGYAILMTNIEYPYGAAVPMYQALVREIFTASHRCADVKVYGNDSLRFSVYEGDKVYLLNTDFDNDIVVTIDYGTHKVKHTLAPCEFKAVEKK